MQINLSEETIKTVCSALTLNKNHLERLLIRVECGTAAKHKQAEFENNLKKVRDALQIFEELLQCI